MPSPKRVGSRCIWDRVKLDAAFAALADKEGHAEDVWDQVAL